MGTHDGKTFTIHFLPEDEVERQMQPFHAALARIAARVVQDQAQQPPAVSDHKDAAGAPDEQEESR